jgi:hypothetical protein
MTARKLGPGNSKIRVRFRDLGLSVRVSEVGVGLGS